jgi:phosphotransferase system  glucose/maltose/N-acetylglucosamine-specific IIC component
MRKEDFIVAAITYHKAGFVRLLILMLLSIVCVATYAPYHDRFEAYLDSRFGGPISIILAIVPAALPIALAFGLLIPLQRRLERKLGAACPHCGKNLADFRGIVIASKNCPFCGLKVLEDNL